MYISQTQTFLRTDSLYQYITYGTVYVFTSLTFSGEWDIVITDNGTRVLHINHSLDVFSDEELFHYSTLLSCEVIQYIMTQHAGLRKTLCHYRTTP